MIQARIRSARSAERDRARLERAVWPFAQLGEALTVLSRQARQEPRVVDLPTPPQQIGPSGRAAWLEAAARQLGLEAERTETPYNQLPDFLATASHAIVPIAAGAGNETRSNDGAFLLLLGDGRIVGPDLAAWRPSAHAIRAYVCAALEAEPRARIHRWLSDIAGPTPHAREAAREALIGEQIAAESIPVWRIRPAADAPLLLLLRRARLTRQLGFVVLAHSLYLALWLVSWWLIGAAALEGHLDRGWLLAWTLTLVTLVPLRVAALRWQGHLAIVAGAVLKERLLSGILNLEQDAVSGEGSGRLLGRVLEAEAIESLVLGGGFGALVAMLELIATAIVLTLGGGLWMSMVLLAWCGVAAGLGARYWRRSALWTATRLAMTNTLVERMVGHRTRLAQQRPTEWHDNEDRELDRYLQVSRRLDRAEAWLASVVPQGWLIVGLLATASTFVTQRPQAAGLAATLGAVLLGARAFRQLVAAFWQLVDARLSWTQTTPILTRASQPPTQGDPLASVISPRSRRATSPAAIDAKGVTYRYPGREEPVLRRCNLTIAAGERLVLEGPSGSGKSTLVAVLAGLRSPQAGVLLAGGVDRATTGADGWRRRLACVPQFHQNHVITGSLGFNLLMGREGPIGREDEQEALEICREMGLGDVISRMPGGLNQLVGETGWQLSQGERSRVFIARALLQRADVVVLDESFAALDGDTLERTLQCVVKRSPALLVVSHR